MRSSNHKIGLWGPDPASVVHGYISSAPRRKRPWGLRDAGWFVFALIATQVVLYAALRVVAIARYDIQTDVPGAEEALNARVTEMLTSGPWLVTAVLLQWAVFVGVPWWATWRKGHRSLRKDFGLWFAKTDPLVGFGLAVLMQMTMFGLGWVVQQTSLDLSGADNTTQVTDHRGWLLAFMIFGAAIMAPLTEELLFRGLILRGMLRRFAGLDLAPPLDGVTDRFHSVARRRWAQRVGVASSVLASSAVFGVMHLQTAASADGSTVITAGHWLVVAQTGLLGLFFAIIAVRTGRLGTTICAHLFFNSISLALVFITTAF